MATLKTQPTRQSVAAFLSAIPDAQRRADCKKVVAIMKQVTGTRLPRSPS